MVGAMGCFVVNDALIKYASETLPATQLIFVRGVMATLLVLAVVQATGATRRIREIARGWVAVRAGVDAHRHAALPRVAVPPPARQRHRDQHDLAAHDHGAGGGLPRRTHRRGAVAGVGAGFLGVMLVIQPTAEGFNGYALVCLLATVFIAIRDLVTRRVHVAVPSILITLSNTVAVMLLAGALSVFEGWRPLRAFEIGLLGVAAAFLASAYYLVVIATRHGDLSLVAPFRYTALLFATIMGFAIWRDVPNGIAWCGIALVIASGIYVLRASRRARATAAATGRPPPCPG